MRLMMPRKPLLFLSNSHALTIATLFWLVSLSTLSANFRVQNCAARLIVRAPPQVHTVSYTHLTLPTRRTV